MGSQRPRVPEGAALDLFGIQETVQVNHCRQLRLQPSSPPQ